MNIIIKKSQLVKIQNVFKKNNMMGPYINCQIYGNVELNFIMM